MPVTLTDLESQYRTRQAAAERRKAGAEADLRGLIATAKAQNRTHLTLPETERSKVYERELIEARGELDACALALSEIGTTRTDESRITAAQSQSRSTGLARPAYDRVARIGREERVYRPDHDPHGAGFLLDVARNFLFADPESAARLQRHMQEERTERPQYQQRVAGDSTTTNWAGLTVPQYLTDMFAQAIAPMRPLADNANHHDLPPQGMTVNISQVTTPSSVALTGELPAGGVSATSIDDTLLTENVQTAAGQVTLSRQAVDRGTGIDEVTMQDLMRRYATTLDSTIINQASTSITATAQVTTYTDASPTPQLLWPNLFKAQSLLEQALEGVAIPDFIVMHPRRWNWFTSTLGATWPLVGGSNTAAQQGGVVMSNEYGSGVRGVLPNGMKVIVDANVPVNLGAGTNQDEIYVIAHQEVHVWEDPNAPVMIRAEQPAAPRLGVLLVCYGYFAYTVRRFANATGKISGTGLIGPSGF